MSRLKSYATGLFLAGLGCGASYCTYDGHEAETDFAENGKITIARTVKYQPEWERRRLRGSLSWIHYHLINYDGHFGKVELDGERPNGTALKVMYHKKRPEIFRRVADASDVGWGIWDWVWRVGGALILFVAALGYFFLPDD